MVHFLKRPGFTGGDGRQGTRVRGIYRVGQHVRCTRCGREAELKQVEAKAKAKVPVMFECPKCGSAGGLAETLEG